MSHAFSIPRAAKESGAPCGVHGERAVLVTICAGIFMLLLDGTIVNVAQAEIRGGLDVGLSEVQWVVDAYLLAFAVPLLAFGRLGVGSGLVVSQTNVAPLREVPVAAAGAASGLLNAVWMTVTVLGVAVLTSLLQGRAETAAKDDLARTALSPEIQTAATLLVREGRLDQPRDRLRRRVFADSPGRRDDRHAVNDVLVGWSVLTMPTDPRMVSSGDGRN